MHISSGLTQTLSTDSILHAVCNGIANALGFQKVCVDHERGIYTLEVLSWAFSLGRKSVKRFLPGQRDVLISKHLRIAARRSKG